MAYRNIGQVAWRTDRVISGQRQQIGEKHGAVRGMAALAAKKTRSLRFCAQRCRINIALRRAPGVSLNSAKTANSVNW